MNDDEQVVTIVRSGNRAYKAYHTDDSCPSLSSARNPQDIPLSKVVEGVEECKHCAGEVEHNNGPSKYLSNALEAMEPEDLGLSPMGERDLVTDGGEKR